MKFCNTRIYIIVNILRTRDNTNLINIINITVVYWPCNSSIFSSTSGNRCMKVVANSTPPPNDSKPLTTLLELRRFPSLLNQSNFMDKSKGKQPTAMDIENKHTMVIIFAVRASLVWTSSSLDRFIFNVNFLSEIWIYKIRSYRSVDCIVTHRAVRTRRLMWSTTSRLRFLRSSACRRTLDNNSLLMIKLRVFLFDVVFLNVSSLLSFTSYYVNQT